MPVFIVRKAGGTVPRLDHETGLGAFYRKPAVLILYTAEEPVGNRDPFGMLFCRRCCIGMGIQHFTAHFIVYARVHYHCHIINGTVMLFVIHSRNVGKMCAV